MNYISVKDAAEKFKLSERRIQKLCEMNRIKGCHMVSGVWLIPVDAKKPYDERLSESPEDTDCLSLKDLCDELSISMATGRNWIKLGKLAPTYVYMKTPYFSKEYAENFKKTLISGQNKALRNRRNKKFVSGNTTYNFYISEHSKNNILLQKLFDIITKEKIELSTNVIQYIIADCALHLFSARLQLTYQGQNNLLFKFLNNDIILDRYRRLIDILIDDTRSALEFCDKHQALFDLDYKHMANEDVLGFIYISCKNLGNRKTTGLYYTPTEIVKKLISKLNIDAHHKILDPCCGTGNFLLQLPEILSFDNIYGNDIDSISVKIARINMALKYPDIGVEKICEHITEMNYLTEFYKTGFDYIIGNPPWGYEFNDEEKKELRKKYKATSGKNIESYDIFIENALSNLTANGQLSYVLPEAILNVKAHMDIRNIILKSSSIRYLEFLGNVFDGVQCPSIILQIANTGRPLSTIGMSVNNKRQIFSIAIERNITSEYFSFTATDQEYMVLQKIKNTAGISSLAGNADFALGIVTGNNKEYISSQKNSKNEMVLKGTNISKYHINRADSYIVFEPEHFQQAAPVEMYRAPEKLLYRFICNQLVFAYDNKQTLSLNSCNIVIPKLKGAKIKYILAILNSRIAQFIYKKEINSFKVLRSHIESIPIPMADEETQNKIIAAAEPLIQGQDLEKASELYNELDNMIFKLFKLTPEEQNIIKSAVDESQIFLV